MNGPSLISSNDWNSTLNSIITWRVQLSESEGLAELWWDYLCTHDVDKRTARIQKSTRRVTVFEWPVTQIVFFFSRTNYFFFWAADLAEPSTKKSFQSCELIGGPFEVDATAD